MSRTSSRTSARPQRTERTEGTASARERGLRVGLHLAAASLLCAGCRAATDPPEPPGGGADFELSFEDFATSVEPILTERGCDAGGGCHGGGIRGTFALSPRDEKSPVFDFEQARLQVNPLDVARSPILSKPLREEAGGAPHAYKPFATKDDPDYRAIEAWILRGVLR